MKDVGVEPMELLEIGTRMAQELQELIDDGVEAGCEMLVTKALLADWEEIYGRSTMSWQNQILALDEGDSFLKSIEDGAPNILKEQAGL
jgi:hypothetical protein